MVEPLLQQKYRCSRTPEICVCLCCIPQLLGGPQSIDTPYNITSIATGTYMHWALVLALACTQKLRSFYTLQSWALKLLRGRYGSDIVALLPGTFSWTCHGNKKEYPQPGCAILYGEKRSGWFSSLYHQSITPKIFPIAVDIHSLARSIHGIFADADLS